jgi:quinol monooxygenase YgiN
VLVQYRVQPDRIDAATRAIRALVDTVLSTEPDCGGISVLRNGADPARITLVETWPSREVFLGPHMQQPHIQAFIQSASALLASPPDLSFWERIDGRATPA